MWLSNVEINFLMFCCMLCEFVIKFLKLFEMIDGINYYIVVVLLLKMLNYVDLCILDD